MGHSVLSFILVMYTFFYVWYVYISNFFCVFSMLNATTYRDSEDGTNGRFNWPPLVVRRNADGVPLRAINGNGSGEPFGERCCPWIGDPLVLISLISGDGELTLLLLLLLFRFAADAIARRFDAAEPLTEPDRIEAKLIWDDVNAAHADDVRLVEFVDDDEPFGPLPPAAEAGKPDCCVPECGTVNCAIPGK